MKVYVDPKTDVDYTAFYIQGLYDYFGPHNVSFSTTYFDGLEPGRTLRFVVYDSDTIGKYVIDWGDDMTINEAGYKWCTSYGKINFNATYTPLNYHDKIVRLAPSFGIKIWNTYTSFYYSIQNFIKSSDSLRHIKRYLSLYHKQNRQLPIASYRTTPTQTNYIYSVNTLWNSDKWINNDETVNLYRANFIKACKLMPSIEFEGGFVYSQVKNKNPKFQDLLIDSQWIPKKEYINKIKDSILVFNTPAWALCHGWKLGEYLALGKAIISTPIVNELPAPLEHGKHIHIVSGSEQDIREAIELIVCNHDYRQSLEKNAHEYYQRYVSPIQSIKLVIGR